MPLPPILISSLWPAIATAEFPEAASAVELTWLMGSECLKW